MNKKEQKLLDLLPQEGFVRIAKPLNVESKERILLIRKANELWQKGDLQAAERIFVTINYRDGLTRLGEHYYNKQDFVKALAYFKQAKDEQRVQVLAQQMANALQKWLKE